MSILQMVDLCRLLLVLCVWSVAANREAASCGVTPVDTADVALIQVRPSRASEAIVASLGARGTCSTTNWDSCRPSPYSGTCQKHLEWAINKEGKSCHDAVAEVTSQCAACSVCISDDCPTPAPTPPPTPTPPASCSSAEWGSCQPSPNSGSCLDHLNYAVTKESNSCEEALKLVSSQCSACSVCSTSDCPATIPSKYYPHFDTSADYLSIGSKAKGIGRNGGSISDNYYLVIGDQGGCGSTEPNCRRQREVASKMHEYVVNRKNDNPNSHLLFILAVGDNFYWTGAKEGSFETAWNGVYSKELTDVPWFAVMGNHDYGDADPTSGCPSVSPRFVCNATNAKSAACGGMKPYSTEAQGYDSNQLDSNKGGVDGQLRTNYHMPDYTYYYTIPQLNFELVAMDWNIYDINGLGGGGARGGAGRLYNHCGGYDRLHQSLTSIKEASTKILNERAQASESGNVAIFSHYPDEFQDHQNLRKMFQAGVPANATGSAKVFNFFGHTHIQQCRGKEDGECVDFLTGGTGGCCNGEVPAGFVAASFDSDKKQKVECFAPDPKCTLKHYARARGIVSNVEHEVPSTDVCQYTSDDPTCPNFLAPGMGHSHNVTLRRH